MSNIFLNKFVIYQETKKYLNLIISELKKGKAAIIATDTVAGIVSLNKNLIYQIKNRNKSKKLILFVNSIQKVKENLNDNFKILAKNFWPGQLTLITNSISYRSPNKLFLLEILKNFEFLYSSSANISGESPIKNFDEAVNSFLKYKNDIIFINGNYNLSNNLPSTVFDTDRSKIIREGVISNEQIKRFIAI